MRILIISGVHGNETSAVQVGLELQQYYELDKNIKVIPFMNISGLLNNSREMIDSSTKDLNRSFKDEVSSYSSTVKNITDIVSSYDVVIDIHNSPRCSNFCLVDEGMDKAVLNICDRAGVMYATRFSKGGTIKDYVNQIGNLGITYEFSGMSTLNNTNEITKAVEDIKKLVLTAKNIDYSQFAEQSKHELKELHCLETGFIEFIKDINQTVKPGEIVFNVLNEQGIVEKVVNPEKHTIQLIALGHSFQARGSSVLQYCIV